MSLMSKVREIKKLKEEIIKTSKAICLLDDFIRSKAMESNAIELDLENEAIKYLRELECKTYSA